MDIKIVNLQKDKVMKYSKYSKEEKEKYLEQNFEQALGLKIIVKEYSLTDEINDKIEFLCIDETNRLTLVEKRYGKDSRTIKSGLMFIDYIKENISKVKMIISDKLGKEYLKDICYDCRLVILTESFTTYDYSSIKSLPYTIEAINYCFLDNCLIFVKEYQNKKREYLYYNGTRNSLYMELESFLLSLGEDISIFGFKNIIMVRKIKLILCILVNQDNMTLYMNKKEYIISNYKQLQTIYEKVEKTYDEN